MKYTVSFILWILLLGTLRAQDNNYWNAQYGAQSTILGGAVVADYKDNGAMYYNPATMSFKDSTELTVSASLYKFEQMKMTNGAGDGLNLYNNNYAVLPQIVSGNFNITRNLEAGIILLTRNDMDFLFEQACRGIYPINTNSPSLMYDFVGEYKNKSRIIEQWGGLSAALKLNSNISIGFTNFFGYRFQKYTQDISSTALAVDTLYNTYNSKLDYSRLVTFDNLNDIIKLGLVYDSKHFNLGLTLTAPSFNIYGLGKTSTYLYASNIDSTYQTYLVYDRETDLRTQYKTPLSTALGLTFKFKKARIHLTGEYFAAIKDYEIMNPNNDLNISRKKSVQYNTTDALVVRKISRRIINFAIGIEQVITPRITLMAGFYSDFNSNDKKYLSFNYSDISITSLDLYHFSLGTSINKKGKIFTVGLNGGYGFLTNQPQVVNFKDPSNNNNLVGNIQNVSTFTYRSLGLVAGFSF